MKHTYLYILIALFCNISLSNAQTLTQTLYFDFGPNDVTNGNITVSPDINGNYWNNPTDSKIATAVPLSLINSQNAETEYVFELLKNFSTNGIKHGGLLNPSVDLLNDFAIATATQDYFFVEGSAGITGAFKLTNLDKNKGYKFYMFGSRTATENRTALYSFTGLNVTSGTLQTSGSNLGGAGYNANNSTIFVSELVYPDINGEINVEVIRQTGNYAHLNVMKIEEYEAEIVKATTISISGDDINTSGSPSQMNIQITPEDAVFPGIIWSVDNEDIAWIDENGVLYPKRNGTINITAKIIYDDIEISDTKEITINNQISNLYISGSATENGDNVSTAIPMKMVTDLNGSVSNIFEIYTSFNGAGSFNFYSSQDILSAIVYGNDGVDGNIIQNGNPINNEVNGTVLLTVNFNTNTYTILPITDLSLVGSATPNGWNVGSGISLSYKGDGVWSDKITLNGGTSSDPARFIVALNKSWGYSLKKVLNTENKISAETQATQHGYSVEDIGSNMNGGTYYVTIDLKNYTYSIDCESVNDYKISTMGSSVANGQGATDMKGYAYMFGELLKKRYSENKGQNWETSGVSVNGNNTLKVLERWNKDLLGDCSGYVIYGLSLGNEGIHESGQASFDQFRDNMLLLIQKARDVNKYPVVTNSYTRGDFNSADYEYVKQMNLLIHEWDVPSINLLGAIDDGFGKWATGYQVEGDIYHPTTEGHAEFSYAFVPSLFDAIESGKSLPERKTGTYYTFDANEEKAHLEFTPEETIHPFTLSFDVKTLDLGIIASFTELSSSTSGILRIDESGYVIYDSPISGNIQSNVSVTDNQWHKISLSHYYAQGRTILYIDDAKVGELSEKLLAETFKINDNTNSSSILSYRDLFFYRSAMNIEEITALNSGKMLKSSLEIYAPLDGQSVLGRSNPFTNYAQSMNNTLELKVSQTTGIGEENPNAVSISLFPNPVTDNLSINGLHDNREYKYNVFSTDGRLMTSHPLKNNQSKLDVSYLLPSIYLMEIIDVSTSEKVFFRFIKK